MPVFCRTAQHGLLWKAKTILYRFDYSRIERIFVETRSWRPPNIALEVSANAADGSSHRIEFERGSGNKGHTFCFVRIIKNQTTPTKTTSKPRSKSYEETPAQSNKLLDQLERLAKLKTAGAITDKEFAAAKKKLLGQ